MDCLDLIVKFWPLVWIVDLDVLLLTQTSHAKTVYYLFLFFTCHLFSQPGVWKPLIYDFLVTEFCPFVLGSVTLTKFWGHCGIKIHQLNFTFLSRFFSDCVQIVVKYKIIYGASCYFGIYSFPLATKILIITSSWKLFKQDLSAWFRASFEFVRIFVSKFDTELHHIVLLLCKSTLYSWRRLCTYCYL